MTKVNAVLTKMVDALHDDVVHSMQDNNRVASGKTIESIQRVSPSEDVVQLQANENIILLEKGRGPTSPNAPAGAPTVLEAIKEWCAIKGIDNDAAWPITQKIHKQGFKGTIGLLSGPLSDDNVNRRADEAANELADLLIFDIIKL